MILNVFRFSGSPDAKFVYLAKGYHLHRIPLLSALLVPEQKKTETQRVREQNATPAPTATFMLRSHELSNRIRKPLPHLDRFSL